MTLTCDQPQIERHRRVKLQFVRLHTTNSSVVERLVKLISSKREQECKICHEISQVLIHKTLMGSVDNTCITTI